MEEGHSIATGIMPQADGPGLCVKWTVAYDY